MSSETLHLELITPSSVAAKLEATEVVLPGFLGEMTVLPDHAPFVGQLRPGIVRIRTQQGQSSFVLGSGFAEISDNQLLVLTRSVQRREDLSADGVRAELAAAQARLNALSMDDPTYASAKEAVELYEAQLAFLSAA